MSTAGAREWSDVSFNFQSGCRNDCVYCYAKAQAIRFGSSSPDDWNEPQLKMPKRWPHGRLVMMPTTHDIDRWNVEMAKDCLRRLLLDGNHVLVVTKARLSVANDLARLMEDRSLAALRDNVEFRVTIGTADESMIRRFEPGAPDYHERLMALRAFWMSGLRTSVSAEPLLGGKDVFDDLYLRVRRYVNGRIWVGKMNMPRSRIRMNTSHSFAEPLIDWIVERQGDEEMYRLWLKYRNDEMVAFKDSIMDVVERRSADGHGE